MTEETDNEELVDGIFGDAARVYEAPARPGKSFLAWHRPRKQFVRDRQWKEQIARLLSDLQADQECVKYLGLPGTDLLDLRFFHNSICEPKGVKLSFLGFNSAAAPSSKDQIELNISLDEVKKLPFIVAEKSNVIPDDFRQIANSTSKAWRETQAAGPFDVVNLDLCDGFAAETPGTLDNTHYNAMLQLLTYQHQRRKPWLLLLTTRVGRDHIHPEAMEKLITVYRDNLNGCDLFRTASKEHLSILDNDELQQVLKSVQGLSNVFLAGLSKWLLTNALDLRPQVKVELKSVIGYRVDDGVEHKDLVSMALKFIPVLAPAIDKVGLASVTVKKVYECELAPSLLKRIAKCVDADLLLSDNKELCQQMTDSMAQLLKLARYDDVKFYEWVQQGCPS
ncbi:MAG: PP_RS20740 family protein [Methylobacter sp.]